MVLPIPTEAPHELPRITLREPAKSMELQIALSRSDLYVTRSPGGDLVPADAIPEATETLEEVLGVLGVRPGRLALIGTYFHTCEDPAGALAAHFCKSEWADGPLADLGSFELHAQKRLNLLEGLTVNSWIRCKTGTVTEANVAQRAVVLERDVNTLPEEADERSFSPDDVASFMKQAAELLATQIEQLFPMEASRRDD